MDKTKQMTAMQSLWGRKAMSSGKGTVLGKTSSIILFLCLRLKKAEITIFLGKRPSAWQSPSRGHTTDFKARWNIHIFRSAEGQQSDFLLHSLPTPQSREDTAKSHFQRLHTQGVFSRSLKLLQIASWREEKFPSPSGNRTCTIPSKKWSARRQGGFVTYCSTTPHFPCSDKAYANYLSVRHSPSSLFPWLLPEELRNNLELNYRFGQLSPSFWAKVIQMYGSLNVSQNCRAQAPLRSPASLH